MRLILSLALLVAAAQAQAPFRPLPALDVAKLRPSMFADNELDLPYYLLHFARVAEGVVPDGPNRGFLSLSVWRDQKDNKPHNARIMENTLSLAFFYTTKRPWNVYYGAPGLRDLLEAALDFWCRIQSPRGAFSEYKPEGWNLAASAFATKFMGRTLRMLREPGAPPVDAALLRRLEAAQRKAIVFVLTDPEMWKHARSYSNQFTNVLPGGLAWLRLHPDDVEIRTLLDKRMADADRELQSPAGYFYEADGADWSYNLGTHHSNLRAAYFYSRGTPVGARLVEEERKFIDWLSYNAVPDGDVWVLNRAIETRKLFPVVRFAEARPLTEEVPLARAFVPSREETARKLAEARRALEKEWPRVAPLPVGTFAAFSPYTFLHREDEGTYPTEAERRAAIAQMPVNRSRSFIEQRKDTREPVVYTFIRRPGYYAVFNSGKPFRAQQRFGLGLLWDEASGGAATMQSQTGSAGEAWGTRADGAPQVYEAASVDARFAEAGDEYTVEYPLGAAGRKRIVFAPGLIRVTVENPGRFVEQFPMLGHSAGIESKAVRTVRPTNVKIGNKALSVVELAGQDRLEYTLRFGR